MWTGSGRLDSIRQAGLGRNRSPPHSRRRHAAETGLVLILGVIGLAQLMVVLNLTVMNIALPYAQRALHFSTAGR